MKIFFVTCVVLALASSTLGFEYEIPVLIARSRSDMTQQSMKAIEGVVSNMEKAANDAMNAVSNLTSAAIKEAQQIRDKIQNDIEKLRSRISDAVERVFKKFSDSNTAVKDCVDSHRTEAASVFKDTADHSMTCVDGRIAEVGTLIEQLKSLASNATTEASLALESMKKCTQDNASLFSTGSCLGVTAVQTELKSVNFLTQSTILIGRINLSIATLPAAVEVCAGGRILQAGVQTGKIIVEIGSCSAHAIFTNITGKA